MNKGNSKAKAESAIIHKLLPYINILLLMIVLFIIVYKLNWQADTSRIQNIMLVGVFGTIIGYIIYGYIFMETSDYDLLGSRFYYENWLHALHTIQRSFPRFR